jgi:hypothetical protein
LDVTQIPNPAYATAIAITSQAALQVAITHHVIVLNNPDPVPTLVYFSPQQLIVVTANIPPTIDATAFADPVGEFFRVLELEFLVNSSEKILQLATFSRQKDETLKMLYKRLLKLKEETEHRKFGNCPSVSLFIRRYFDIPCASLQRVFAEFGDSYILFDVYNILEKLELAHAHYEASIMRPPSRSRLASTSCANQIITFFFES